MSGIIEADIEHIPLAPNEFTVHLSTGSVAVYGRPSFQEVVDGGVSIEHYHSAADGAVCEDGA